MAYIPDSVRFGYILSALIISALLI